MSKKAHRFHVRADLPDNLRDILLKKYRPAFPNVFARSVTLAYGVGRFYEVPSQITVTVYGVHKGSGTDALLVMVDKQLVQPKREGEDFERPYHITLSTAQNVPPAEAGKVDPTRIKMIPTFSFTLQPKLMPLRQAKPEVRDELKVA